LFRYIGNLPPGITVPQLGDFVNTALQQLGFSKDIQKSVLSAWISPDGHYGFCEVRTVEEATAALTYLNGIQVGAYCLKIGRPKGYTGTTPAALPLQGNNLPLHAITVLKFYHRRPFEFWSGFIFAWWAGFDHARHGGTG